MSTPVTRRALCDARHAELPPSAGSRHPHTAMLHSLRSVARFVVRGLLGVRLHGSEHVPVTGGVIYASNHVGISDGPLLAMFGPRPAHALTKEEMFRGVTGTFLAAAGQISLDRFHADPGAIKACLRVLRDGGAIAIFPEGGRGDGELRRFHHGAAYLALVTGAPVVPVTMIGTREPGGGLNSLPKRGAQVDIVYGEPFLVDAVPWPRTREHVRNTSALLLQHLQEHLDAALAMTGRALPGPMPVANVDDDPDTGFVEQGAT